MSGYCKITVGLQSNIEHVDYKCLFCVCAYNVLYSIYVMLLQDYCRLLYYRISWLHCAHTGVIIYNYVPNHFDFWFRAKNTSVSYICIYTLYCVLYNYWITVGLRPALHCISRPLVGHHLGLLAHGHRTKCLVYCVPDIRQQYTRVGKGACLL